MYGPAVLLPPIGSDWDLDAAIAREEAPPPEQDFNEEVDAVVIPPALRVDVTDVESVKTELRKRNLSVSTYPLIGQERLEALVRRLRINVRARRLERERRAFAYQLTDHDPSAPDPATRSGVARSDVTTWSTLDRGKRSFTQRGTCITLRESKLAKTYAHKPVTREQNKQSQNRRSCRFLFFVGSLTTATA